MTSRDVHHGHQAQQLAAAAVPSPHAVEHLFDEAEAALAALKGPSDAVAGGVPRFEFQDFSSASAGRDLAALNPIRDADLDLRIELGRSQMSVEELAELRKGSVVPLDKLVGDPADIFVDGRLVARGEVLVLDDNFCVRVTELLAGSALSRGE
jgi:flagellar motor switch protein FliN